MQPHSWLLRTSGLLVLLAFGCATLDKPQIREVKKVAIIGAEGRIAEGNGPFGERIASIANQQYGTLIYSALAKQMAKTMKWKFVNLEKVEVSPSIEAANKETINSVLRAISWKDKVIVLNGILQPIIAFSKIDNKVWRKKVMKELEVDSLLVFSFEVTQFRPWYMAGLPAAVDSTTLDVRKLRCKLNLSMYNGPNDKPIWSTGFEEGGESKNPSLIIYGIPFTDDKQAAVMGSCSQALAKLLTQLN